LRYDCGTTVLKEDLSLGYQGVSIEDAVRLNASALACQCFVGSENEVHSLKILTDAVDAGNKFGIPVLGVTAVGKEMARDERYLGLATRVIAELGASFVKTYYCQEGFDKVVAGCPVPIVIAGGKRFLKRTLSCLPGRLWTAVQSVLIWEEISSRLTTRLLWFRLSALLFMRIIVSKGPGRCIRILSR
jgi:hypothetical protein